MITAYSAAAKLDTLESDGMKDLYDSAMLRKW